MSYVQIKFGAVKMPEEGLSGPRQEPTAKHSPPFFFFGAKM
jgi:hypothetical protein